MTGPILKLLRLLALACLLAGAGQARADHCNASMTDIAFGTVNALSNADVQASGTLTVTCHWTILLNNLAVLPNASVCVNLGAGSGGGANPRYLANGSQRLAFNLYTDTTWSSAAIWGGTALPGTSAYPVLMAGLLALGSSTRSFPIHARIPASALAGLRTEGNAATEYSSNFSGQGTVSYAFGTLLAPNCASGGSTAFSFKATATVGNDCIINAGNLDFGAYGALKTTVRSNAALNVQCTANNAYQVTLGPGLHGSVAARKMKNAATGETIGYSLSATPDGAEWGNGGAGTSVHGGTGTGAPQPVPVHGAVRPQATPSPGNYRDTVTATVVF